MLDPILATKILIPPVCANLVPRPQLVERFNKGLNGKLILVSAPAGFGKTTIVENWIISGLDEDLKQRLAWLSLDDADNDLPRFFMYFIAALQTVEPDLCSELLAAFTNLQNSRVEVVLTLMINEIATIKRKLILVIDDYHLISNLEIHTAVQFILENLPSNLLLVMTSRDEPFLPLSRLRARGQMLDIRTRDLRFSSGEASQYLNQIMGLGLADDEIAALETRTEGWVTGLRLAALSMRDQIDPQRFISEFAGNDRYIIDYLVDEVLSQRSEETRQFLLRTSVVNRMCGALCEAITGQENACEILQKLEQENVFLVPLDNHRQWYRYHHLFSDVLRLRLTESMTPDEIKAIHSCASRWFENEDMVSDAVDHAFNAIEYDRVIRLINEHAEQFFLSSQLHVLMNWIGRIPKHLLDSNPRLYLIIAWAHVSTGKPEEAELCLQAVEKALGVRLLDWLDRQNNEISSSAQGALIEMAVVRAQLAISRGDIPDALRLTAFALPYLERDDCPYLFNRPAGSRMAACFIRGTVLKRTGDLEQAAEAFIQAGILAKEQNHVHIVALSHGHLANMQAVQGHLLMALETCRRGLSDVEQMAGERSPLSGFLHGEYGNLLYEINDLEAAERHLKEAVRLAKPWGFLDAIIPGLTGLSQLYALQGKWKNAFDSLDELEDLGKSNPPLVQPVIDAHRALLWSMQGDEVRSRQWIDSLQPDITDGIRYGQQGELIILSRVLITLNEMKKAEELLERLLADSRSRNHRGRMITLLALRSCVHQTQEDRNEALMYLDQALSLAASEGYIRTFLDLGEPIKSLLPLITSRPDYAKNLLVSMDPQSRQSHEPIPVMLVEPLSEREKQVLRLLATELTGPEIARELVVAISTLRTHTQQIYRKLGVTNRQGAIKAARTLGIIQI